MKESTVKLIRDKFEQDIGQIDSKIRRNKWEINKLAREQKQLKDTKKGLYEILKLIK